MRIDDTEPPARASRASRRPELSAATLTVLGAAVMFVGYNATYWSRGLEIFSGHPFQFAILNLAIYCVTVAIFGICAVRPLVKPFLGAMFILSAVTSYYVDTLGVTVDRDMIQNVASTTFMESKHLLTFGFLLHVALFGLLPTVLLSFVRVKRQRWMATAGIPVALFALGLLFGAGLLMTNYKIYASVFRERRDLMASYQPGAPLVGAVRYAAMVTRSANRPVEAIGLDARKGGTYGQGRKPVVTIIVAGETARTQNFSLNGYGVPTNPELAKRAVVSFRDVSSCGTATAVSLPCMFSRYGRADYSYEKGITTESLLDVLAHAGFAVDWWDNNTGDKGVATRVATRTLDATDDPEACVTGECTDAVFLSALAAYLPTITQDTVLVLHQIGSHGPAYSLRYPPGFGPFGPTCETAEFADCTPQEITNAYDNTIAYTDHILAQTINMLAAQDDLATSMLYVSDHGESLGEGGLYLHGAPYFMAPDVQTKVPMILWMSKAFEVWRGVDEACIGRKADDALSHDNLFHSVLGMLDVTSEVREPALDIFAGCTSGTKVAME